MYIYIRFYTQDKHTKPKYKHFFYNNTRTKHRLKPYHSPTKCPLPLAVVVVVVVGGGAAAVAVAVAVVAAEAVAVAAVAAAAAAASSFRLYAVVTQRCSVWSSDHSVRAAHCVGPAAGAAAAAAAAAAVAVAVESLVRLFCRSSWTRLK